MELHHASENNWKTLISSGEADAENLEKFQIYAALFLFNQGNYYGYGDKKFVPGVPAEFLKGLASKASSRAKTLLDDSIGPMLSSQPGSLGYPGKKSQSGYYLGDVSISKDEVHEVDELLKENGIHPENTRVLKQDSKSIRVLQACTKTGEPKDLGETSSGLHVSIEKGDYADTLISICEAITKAREHAENDTQKKMLDATLDYFASGDVSHFKEAQTVWLQDRSPVVESIIGFVESYRDPTGKRAEFESIVALTDKDASKRLQDLVDRSHSFISELPWVSYFKDQEGMGPFESDRFESPDFTAVHGTSASCHHLLLLIT